METKGQQKTFLIYVAIKSTYKELTSVRPAERDPIIEQLVEGWHEVARQDPGVSARAAGLFLYHGTDEQFRGFERRLRERVREDSRDYQELRISVFSFEVANFLGQANFKGGESQG